jgi:hypothetical protein
VDAAPKTNLSALQTSTISPMTRLMMGYNIVKFMDSR